MSIKSKCKLFFGLLLVALLSAGLFAYTDYSSSRMGSTSAILKSNTITVGTDYAGTITRQFVRVGDHVAAGQELFHLKSSTLVQALNSNQVQQKDLLFSLTPENELIITASSAGYVSSIDYGQGSYVPMASKIATIATDSEMTVTAKFRMAPSQYAHTTSDTPLEITLPDGSKIAGRITNIAIDGQSNPLLVTVRATASSNNDHNVKSGQEGIPVVTNLTLKQNTYWDKIASWGSQWRH